MSVESTSAFGPSDLDTRPPEMERSTISAWVQQCPECDYCSRSLGEAPAGAQTVVDSPEYRRQLIHPDYPELANAFLCLRMISEVSGSWSDAAWASIHAAWACDDDARPEAATKCRIEAIRLITALHNRAERLAEDPGADEAILTDLLRRAGKFDEALDVVDRSLLQDYHRIILAVLRFRRGLISAGDAAAHLISETDSGRALQDGESSSTEPDPGQRVR